MPPAGWPRLTIAVAAAVGLVAGAGLGWALRPVPTTPPPAAVPSSALITDALDTLDNLEALSAGVVEILDDMIGGNVSSTALEGVRDSMQEIRAGLSDAKSQIAQLRR